MDNVKTEIKGKTLTITVDISKRLGPSKSGKTMIIATTSGNAPIGDGIVLGLNVYTKEGIESGEKK